MQLERKVSFDLPILMYHYIEDSKGQASPYAISLSQWTQQLDYLKRHNYQTLSFAELYKLLDSGARPPRKSVILTFDDGSMCFHEFVLPALAARGMKATAFLVAGEIGGINRWDAEKGGPRRILMGETEIGELVNQGIELGAHGWSHRRLTACGPADLTLEVEQSRQELERRFGQPITTFSYPYGEWRREHLSVLARAGYQGAVSVFAEYPFVTSNRYAMRRIPIHSGDNVLRFALKMSRLYLRYVAHRDRQGIRE